MNVALLTTLEALRKDQVTRQKVNDAAYRVEALKHILSEYENSNITAEEFSQLCAEISK